MQTRRKVLVPFALIALAGWAALAIAATDVSAKRREGRYAAPGGSELVVRVPVGWKEEKRRVGADRHPAIAFKARSSAQFDVLLSPLPSRYGKSPDAQERLRKDVVAAADTLRGQMEEPLVVVNELLGLEGQGYFFSITDRAPKKGEYKYMTQGLMIVGELQLAFTILTNDGQEAVVDAALGMVRNVRVVRAAR